MFQVSFGLANVFFAIVVVFAGTRILDYMQYAKQTGYLPGIRSLVTPISLFGVLFPTSRWNPGREWQWQWRKDVYKRHGTETISSLPYLFGGPAIYTSSLDVARQIVAMKGEFYKTKEMTAITLVWGPNVFAANGDEWKRFRRIMNPAFATSTFASVWDETCRGFREMFVGQGWDGLESIDILDISPLTNKFALMLISSAGFGHPLSWDPRTPGSKTMSFGEALHIITHNLILRLVVPRIAYWLPIKRLQDIKEAYKIVRVFLLTLIDTRRKEFAAGAPAQNDVLSLMILSAENEGHLSMTDDELIGNTSILLFAGHDTLAMTLNATLGFMGLYHEYQEEMYQEVLAVMPTSAEFTFGNSRKLRKVQACFLETLRYFLAGFMWIRDTAEDIVLEHVGPNRDQRIAVPRGTPVVVDAIGLHHNPRLFPEPDKFKPERWYDAPESALTMFSLGTRVRIGRRFAITAGVCFLANLLRDWRVELLAPHGESRAEWEARYRRA
ncbi:cytochrome P450 [Epithele typhae]|uniref:cytochrome P450 n=1 Tax=Epithele typhae TaxID=378194 RepID=UPI002008D227|nr:cytochrome P450 [Epithele typhae]KAH9912149.1 cytochrome P450 [Epithele typhae]